MEIFYLHIKEYNQFKNADINFGGEFRFFYNPKKKELKIEENPHYIRDFFKTNKSYNSPNSAYVNKVSCIIGENGAGKTTVLNFIKANLIQGVTSITNSLILAIKTNDGRKIVYFFEDETNIVIHNCNDYGFELKSLKFKKSYPDKNNKKYEFKSGPFIPQELKGMNVIYLSNVFDKSSDSQLSGLYNLSTNFLIKEDKRSLVERKIINNLANEVDVHRTEDVFRQVNFLFYYSGSKQYIKFNLPEVLSFKPKPLKDFVHNDLAKKTVIGNKNPNSGFIEDLIGRTKKEINISQDAKRNTILTFSINCIINFLDEIYQRYSSIPQEIKFDYTLSGFLKKFSFSNDLFADVFTLINELKEQAKNEIPKNIDSIYYDWLTGIESYCKILKEIINTNSHKYSLSNVGNAFSLNRNTKQSEIQELLRAYTSTFQLTPHLDFEWRNMSSGELALLNLFSRLYTRVDSEVWASNAKLLNNVLILIDEADAYLHPHWSQTIVQSIIDFVSDIYTSYNGVVRNIQIIFTSNSPFIAADIPSSNVVFLKKETSEKGELTTNTLNSLEDKKETFGANIHTLLLDSFFLPLGALSDFARNKIEYVIEKLNSPKPFTPEEKEELRKIIGIIGEPVIKNKLLQMFNDRYNIDIDGRIKRLEDELIVLKGKK